MMQLAVVERELILQQLDLQALSRMACTCKQLRAESLHPASGCFLPALRTVQLHPALGVGFGYDSPLVRIHVPVVAKLDARPYSVDLAGLGRFIDTLASFRRVTTLSLWGSPEDCGEEEALRLIAAVPHLETLWAVRTGSVFVQSARVQKAIFSLPQLTECGFDFMEPGGEFQPALLALAPKLHRITITVSLRDLNPLLLLPSLNSLRSLRLVICSTTPETASRDVLSIALPSVEECLMQVVGGGHNVNPSVEQCAAILRGMPGLKVLSFGVGTTIAAVALQAITQLGPSCFPALQRIELSMVRHYHAGRTRQLLAILPALEFRVHVASDLRDSDMLDVRTGATDANGREYVSVRRLPTQPDLQ